MALLGETASSQHMLQLLARAGNIHDTAVICPGRKKTDDAGFTGQLAAGVPVPHKKDIHISGPVNERSFTRLGDHYGIRVLENSGGTLRKY